MPEDESWREWMRGYRTLYLEKDVLPIRRLGAPDDFLRFMAQTALRSSGIHSLSGAARDAGVPLSSAENYLRLIEGSCQWFRVPPYYRNLGKRLVKAPKGYWFDSGVLAFLMGVATWGEAQGAGRLGALFETWAANELRAAIWSSSGALELYYWRTYAGAEVDFVVAQGERLLPIEVKAADSLASVKLRGLGTFLQDHGSAAPFGVVIHGGAEHQLIGPRIVAVSARAL
jgi:predicted AAA+ superfamily ATPase